jgi:F-type H+-transporting ATPase subunit epsilon
MILEVVTPQGSAISQEVEEVTAPGAKGEFGVLPGHTPFLSALRAGVLRFRAGGQPRAWAIGPGYVEVTGGDKVVLLTRSSQRAEDVDLVQAKKELEEADAAAKLAPDGAARAVAEDRRAWAQARIDAAAK